MNLGVTIKAIKRVRPHVRGGKPVQGYVERGRDRNWRVDREKSWLKMADDLIDYDKVSYVSAIKLLPSGKIVSQFGKTHAELEKRLQDYEYDQAIYGIHPPDKPEYFIGFKEFDALCQQLEQERADADPAWQRPAWAKEGADNFFKKTTKSVPSSAQISAGNYPKRKLWIEGLEIAIENEKGSVRHGVGKDGKPWHSKMHVPYGYIKRTGMGADGEALDVFVGPKAQLDKVWVINQVDPHTGEFDETKTVLGVDNEQEARELYLSHYPAGWQGIGSIKEKSFDEFKEWAKNGKTEQAIKALKRVKAHVRAGRPVKGYVERGKDPAMVGQNIAAGFRWASQLSPEERRAVHDYISNSRIAAGLDTALNKASVPKPFTAYRGVMLEPDEIDASLKINEFHIKGFLSATQQLSIAREFAERQFRPGDGKAMVLFTILVPQGAKGAYLDAIEGPGRSNEREFLMARGQTLQVKDYKRSVTRVWGEDRALFEVNVAIKPPKDDGRRVRRHQLPEPGYLKIAVKFPNGEVVPGGEMDRTHNDIMARLWKQKHPNLVSENDPEVEEGWVGSDGTFYERDWVLKLIGDRDSWGIPTIKIPDKPQRKALDNGWIAVDLDGTLAHYDGDMSVIGEPVPKMMARVKRWLAEGKDVRIFTARVADPFNTSDGSEKRDIEKWCKRHIGQALPITSKKDPAMIALYDDRAFRVKKNEGTIVAKALTLEAENALIRENKKKPEASQRHKFKAAEWTHANGHPRCLICGDEEGPTEWCKDRTLLGVAVKAIKRVPPHIRRGHPVRGYTERVPQPALHHTEWVHAYRMPDGTILSGEAGERHPYEAVGEWVSSDSENPVGGKMVAVRGFHPPGKPEMFVNAATVDEWEKKHSGEYFKALLLGPSAYEPHRFRPGRGGRCAVCGADEREGGWCVALRKGIALYFSKALKRIPPHVRAGRPVRAYTERGKDPETWQERIGRWISPNTQMAVKLHDGKVISGVGHVDAIEAAYKYKFGDRPYDRKHYGEFKHSFYDNHEHGVRGVHPIGKPEQFVSMDEVDKWEKARKAIKRVRPHIRAGVAVRGYTERGKDATKDQLRNRLMAATRAVRLKSGEIFTGTMHQDAVRAAYAALKARNEATMDYTEFFQSFYDAKDKYGERGLLSGKTFIPMEDIYKWEEQGYGLVG